MRARLVLLEKLVLKNYVLTGLNSGMSLDQAVDSGIRSLQVDDEVVKFSLAGLDPGEVGLYEAELREIVENMHAFLESLRKFRPT